MPRRCFGHEGPTRNLCFSPDDQTLISHGDDHTVRFWHVPTCSELIRLGTADDAIRSMALNPEGNLLVFGGNDRLNRCGLQIHRLGPNRDSLPKTFGLPAAQP